jgi:serine-type D-Ala-D-Ala carboxypeptidase (penicillin-binding protein 5/6)
MPRLGRIALVAGVVVALTVPAALVGATALSGTAVAASGAVRHLTDVPGPSGVSAQDAAIEDAATGTVLWSRNLDNEWPMASITKVMTALVVLRIGGLNTVLTVPKAVTSYVKHYGASSAGLHPRDRLTVRQLLYALLLPSGSDAGYTLASAYGPGIPAFVAKMNVTAQALGMTRSHFSNFDGLPYPTATST